jgi:hypothetical protein
MYVDSEEDPDEEDDEDHWAGTVGSGSAAGAWGDRVVASIDLDCFYAQCEELRNPALKGKPLGVQQKLLVSWTLLHSCTRSLRFTQLQPHHPSTVPP